MSPVVKPRANDPGRDKRRAPRRMVTGPALILGPDLDAGCIIRDLSATGARIEVPASIKLPPAFNLLLLKTNSSRHVLLRWQRGDFAGVEFVLPTASGTPERK